MPITNLEFVSIFGVRISFLVEIADAHHIFKSLRAHRARIHAQRTADCPRDSFHPFHPPQICGPRCVGNFLQLYASAGGNLVALDVDFVKIAAARMENHAANAAIAHEQIRTASDDEDRKIFAPAKANQFCKRRFSARLDPKLRGTAHSQSRVLGERLIETNVAFFVDDLFQLLRNHEIGSQDRQLLVNVSGAETQNEIAGIEHVSHVPMHPFQTRLVADAAMAMCGDFVGDDLASHACNRRFV